MKILTLFLTTLVALAPVASAQTRAQLKKDLATKLTEAASSEDKMKVAEWAKEVGLVTDYKKILNAIVEAEPDFAAAHEALGHVQFDGKWMSADQADQLRKDALAATYKAKGYVQVGDVWVEKDKAEDAKKGLFWHGGELVSKAEKLGFLAGQVRHPVTGQLIAASDLEKASQGLYRIEDRWVGVEEANKFHSQLNRPWVIRTKHATLMTTLPLADHEQLTKQIDPAIERLLPIFGTRTPSAEHRPLVGVAANQQEFVTVGDRIGGAGSAYGAFLAEQPLPPTMGGGRPAVALWVESWGPYYVRHAAGLALVHSLNLDMEGETPLWFARAVGGHVDRLWTEQTAKFFGNRHAQNGGVVKLEDWFEKFAITSEMETEAMWSNIFQAGLVLDFCMKGGDKAATKALMDVTKAYEKDSKAVGKALTRMQKIVSKKQSELRKYLRGIVAG